MKTAITIIAMLALCGCKNTVILIPRENLPPVKIVDQRLMYPSSAKDIYGFVDGKSVHIEIGRIESRPDPNSIEALGGLVGQAIKTAVRP